jgi:hypothetical protein
MWFIKTYTFWYKLYKEIRTWWIFRKTSFKNVELLNSNDLRVDFIGRIYTVVNLPEEVAGASQEVHHAYVLQNITNFGKVMMQIGLADVVYPEIEKVKNSPAYLVIMWPVFERLQLLNILAALIRTTVQTGSLYFIYRLIVNHIDFNKILEFIISQF